jgi:hypothetical protein
VRLEVGLLPGHRQAARRRRRTWTRPSRRLGTTPSFHCRPAHHGEVSRETGLAGRHAEIHPCRRRPGCEAHCRQRISVVCRGPPNRSTRSRRMICGMIASRTGVQAGHARQSPRSHRKTRGGWRSRSSGRVQCWPTTTAARRCQPGRTETGIWPSPSRAHWQPVARPSLRHRRPATRPRFT